MSLKEKAFAGVKWTGLSSITVAVLQLAQVVVLARYLAPSDFGLMAIVSVVIGFSAIFMDMGISGAIIHKQDITKNQLTSLYWLNVTVGIVLALIVYLLAPKIALFYKESLLTDLIRLLSLTFIFSAVGNQYRVLYQKELFFDKIAKVEILSSLTAFLVAIICALSQLGVYSLVYAALTKSTIANMVFLIKGANKHRPGLHFNYDDIKSIISFGLFQVGERGINYFNSQFDTIIIGKILGAESLGIYSIAKTLVMRPAQIINPIITKVTFPIMAKVQNDERRLRNIYLETINYLCTINSPIYIALAVLAEPIIILLFGNKWIDAAVLVQILSVYFIVRSTANPIGSLQLAKGRADLGFYWNLGLFCLSPVSIYLGSFYKLEGVAYSLVILSLLYIVPNWYFMVRPLCGAKFREYFSNVVEPMILSSVSAMLALIVSSNVFDGVYIKAAIFLSVATICYVMFNFVKNTKCTKLVRSYLKS